MIGWRKFGVSRVFAFKHSGRMRHPNEKHCVFPRVGRRFVKRAPGMLLEHVENVLHAREIPLANAIHSLVKPANRRSKRNAAVANFSFAL